jgi:hypothetical protein
MLRGGVELNFVDEGSGEPAMVCVHGWCCRLNHFDPQRENYFDSHIEL